MSFSVGNISKNWPDVKSIPTSFPLLEISLFLGDVDTILLPLYEKNLKNDYAKTLKGNCPQDLSLCDFVDDTYGKMFRNECTCDEITNANREIPYDLNGLFYLVTLDKVAIGTLEIYKDGDGVQFGIFIDEDYSRKGIATAVINSAIAMLKNVTCVKTVRYECYSNNSASIRLALKTGFDMEERFEIYPGREGHRFILHI